MMLQAVRNTMMLLVALYLLISWTQITEANQDTVVNPQTNHRTHKALVTGRTHESQNDDPKHDVKRGSGKGFFSLIKQLLMTPVTARDVFSMFRSVVSTLSPFLLAAMVAMPFLNPPPFRAPFPGAYPPQVFPGKRKRSLKNDAIRTNWNSLDNTFLRLIDSLSFILDCAEEVVHDNDDANNDSTLVQDDPIDNKVSQDYLTSEEVPENENKRLKLFQETEKDIQALYKYTDQQ